MVENIDFRNFQTSFSKRWALQSVQPKNILNTTQNPINLYVLYIFKY